MRMLWGIFEVYMHPKSRSCIPSIKPNPQPQTIVDARDSKSLITRKRRIDARYAPNNQQTATLKSITAAQLHTPETPAQQPRP